MVVTIKRFISKWALESACIMMAIVFVVFIVVVGFADPVLCHNPSGLNRMARRRVSHVSRPISWPAVETDRGTSVA